MTYLFETYRPRCLADVVGQPKAVAVAQRLIDRGAGGLCISLTNQGTAQAFARLCVEIADAAGLNGCPDADKRAMRIVREEGGNMRAVIRRIEAA